jgi:hypothetical protein
MQIHGWEEIVTGRFNFNFYSNKGSVLIITAMMLPIFILVIGMVVDIGRAMVFKEELNKACMIAAEESSRCIDIESAQNFGINKLAGNYPDIIYEYFNKNYEKKDYASINYLNYNVIENADNPKYIEVTCEAKVECFFLKIVGINDILVHCRALGRLRRIK